jgi:hypothetical protein
LQVKRDARREATVVVFGDLLQPYCNPTNYTAQQTKSNPDALNQACRLEIG